MNRTMTYIMAAVMIFGLWVPAGASLNDGLVAYYPFNGNADDESGNENHGAVYGATLTVDRFGNPDSAYAFDGQGDFIRIPDSDSLDITGDLSVAAWVKTDSDDGLIFSNMLEVSPHDGYQVKVDSFWDGAVLFMSGGDQLVGFEPVNTGGWRHVCVTLSGTTAYIYIDGLLDNSGPVGVPTANDVDQTIGASYTPWYFFDGVIDDVFIYDRALSESEVEELYGTVDIDIEPRRDPNYVVVTRRGRCIPAVLPVAILSTEDFSAPDEVERDSLTFGSTGDEDSLICCSRCSRDIDHDGYRDLVCYFWTKRCLFDAGDTEGILKGVRTDGAPIRGSDFVDIIVLPGR